MGLLDDAIREHLELKRRHGADPDEVSRQEREALGAPARGEFAQPGGAEAQAEAEAPVQQAAAPEEPAPAEEPQSEVDEELREPPEDALEPEPEPGYDEDPWLPEEDEEPRAAEAPTEVVPADAEPPADDVLEETPEFLQETPEHDRLWFEQKPPRDFDWDK
jgi:hypothetical protein